MDSNAASDEIKSLAINGLLADVESKFGRKKAAKAVSYVEAKLQSLKEKQKAGQSLDNVLYATPFMLYAITQDGKQASSTQYLHTSIFMLMRSSLLLNLDPSDRGRVQTKERMR